MKVYRWLLGFGRVPIPLTREMVDDSVYAPMDFAVELAALDRTAAPPVN